jgi:hypothetical protein
MPLENESTFIKVCKPSLLNVANNTCALLPHFFFVSAGF